MSAEPQTRLSRLSDKPPKPKGRTGQRRFAPKTRNGCMTCRVRRVKCDETKPACDRCTSTGRKCDGYDFPKNHQPHDLVGTAVSLLLPATTSWSALEHRAFHHFRTRTVPCLSVYSTDTTWDAFLRIGATEPAAWHAANALSGLHETRLLRKQAGQLNYPTKWDIDTDFHFRQYSQAVVGLKELLQRPSVPMEIVLACSIMLVHFEALRERFDTALMHVENSFRLMYSLPREVVLKLDFDLVTALMRIDDQGFFYVGVNAAPPGAALNIPTQVRRLPTTFHNLSEAKDYIDAWVYYVCCFGAAGAVKYKYGELGNPPLNIVAQAQEFDKIFTRMDEMLSTSFGQPAAQLDGVHARVCHAMLHAWLKVARIFTTTLIWSDPMQFDDFTVQFREINELCTYVLKYKGLDFTTALLTLDQGLLYPLAIVAIQCRDSKLRRSALSMLRDLADCESDIWDINAIADVAEICIDYEETVAHLTSPVPEDIPAWQRIHGVVLQTSAVSRTNGTNLLEVQLMLRLNGSDGGWHTVFRSKQRTQLDQSIRPAGPQNKFVPINLFGVWWASPIVSTTTGRSYTPKPNTPSFGTARYRAAYLTSQNHRFDGGADIT